MSAQNRRMTVSILIPCFNEERYIRRIVEKVAGVPLECNREIIIVDDASTDNTVRIIEEISRHYPIILVRHTVNKGKGGAISTGLRRCSGDMLIIQDADLEYDPGDYPRLIEPVLRGRADVVYGSRFLKKENKAHFIRRNRIANQFLTWLSNLFSGLKVTDMETCYKVLARSIYQQLTITEKRFGVEPEITAKLARLKPRLVEVPIHYRARSVKEGKKINWKDGLSAIRCIVKYNILTRRETS